MRLAANRSRLLRIVGWGACARRRALARWMLFLAPTTGKWATSFGSAVHDPKDFLITLLNGITAAGLYFVVASGFTLIFGLMRVVNMAHGAFFLLGGYIALRLQRHIVGEGGAFGLTSDQVNLTYWIVPALVGTASSAPSARDAAALPALEPGPGTAPGADHDRDLDHPRRPDARPLRGRRRGHRLAAATSTRSSTCTCPGSSTR